MNRVQGNEMKDESAPDSIHQVLNPELSGLKSSVLPLDQAHWDPLIFKTTLIVKPQSPIPSLYFCFKKIL